MKIKHQLAIFNAITRLLIILILWFSMPILIENIFYKFIDENLFEKKQKFLQHINKQEINDFIDRDDSNETYVSFSNLHNEFLQLYQSKSAKIKHIYYFKSEFRIIEDEENEYRVLYNHFSYEGKNYILEIGSSLSDIKELIAAIQYFIVVLLIVIIVFSFIVDTFFIEFLLKPFYKIIDKKIRFANEPDFFDATPIPSYSKDFHELDEAINQMMLRIQALFKNEKQFIANVSHELLSPIALLKNRFENLLQNETLNDDAVDKIASSLKTLDLLKKIINNLLLISRIENNQYHLNETIDFGVLIEEILEEVEYRLEQKSIKLEKNIIHSFTFKGNKTLLHILLYNILVNAIKFNPEKGLLKIEDGFDENRYFISISDSGCGMTTEQLDLIFNRFTKINVNKEGQGLGLAIALTVAQFHQIEIKVSAQINIGSVFKLVFPTKS
jgi:signal transduction histidine kinase